MKRFGMFFIVSIFVLPLFFSCKRAGHYFLIIRNNADYGIYVQDIPVYGTDTFYRCQNIPYYIKPHSCDTIEYSDSYETYFSIINKNGAEYIQFIVVDTMTRVRMRMSEDSCKKISENNEILKRYQWKLEDFEANNWTLVYPD